MRDLGFLVRIVFLQATLMFALLATGATHAQGGRAMSMGINHAASYQVWESTLTAMLNSQGGCLSEAAEQHSFQMEALTKEYNQSIAAYSNARERYLRDVNDIGGLLEDIGNGSVGFGKAAVSIYSGGQIWGRPNGEEVRFNFGQESLESALARMNRLSQLIQQVHQDQGAFARDYVRKCLEQGALDIKAFKRQHESLDYDYGLADLVWIALDGEHGGVEKAGTDEWVSIVKTYYSSACSAELQFHEDMKSWGMRHFWEMRYGANDLIFPPEPISLIADYEVKKRAAGVDALVEMMMGGAETAPGEQAWQCP